MKRLDSQRGAVLIIAVFLLLLAATLAIGLSLLHRSDVEAVTNQIQDMQAFYCAETGIERALYEIREFPSQPSPNWPQKAVVTDYAVWEDESCASGAGMDLNTGNTYTVLVTEGKGDPTFTTCYNYVWLYSTGKAGNITRTIRMLVRRSCVKQTGPPPPADYYYTQVLVYEVL